MSFLQTALFALLVPLVALPLVIHLLNRGFPSHFRFPSIELIKQTLRNGPVPIAGAIGSSSSCAPPSC